jgi:hypothetical protein
MHRKDKSPHIGLCTSHHALAVLHTTSHHAYATSLITLVDLCNESSRSTATTHIPESYVCGEPEDCDHLIFFVQCPRLSWVGGGSNFGCGLREGPTWRWICVYVWTGSCMLSYLENQKCHFVLIRKCLRTLLRFYTLLVPSYVILVRSLPGAYTEGDRRGREAVG